VVVIFSDSRGVVHKEFVPPGITVNEKYYLEILDRLRKRVMQVRMENADDWIIRASTERARTQHCQFVNFWRKSAFPCFCRLPILQVCHLVSATCYQN
jgi:hypothetical protein